MGNSKTKPEKSDSTETIENNNTSTPSIYPQLQIRNCIRNVRNNSSTFSDLYPNEAGTSCGQVQSSVYTIDVNNAMPANFSNPAYVSTEGSGSKNPTNDGLPSYEEAIGAVKTPVTPASEARSTIEVLNEDDSTRDGDVNITHGGRRHRRRHRHHRHHHNSQNENSERNATDSEPRRHRHKRGFRFKRRHHTETE